MCVYVREKHSNVNKVHYKDIGSVGGYAKLGNIASLRFVGWESPK